VQNSNVHPRAIDPHERNLPSVIMMTITMINDAICFLRRGSAPEGRFLAEYYGFNATMLISFQAIKNLSAHSLRRFGLFCEVFGDFWVYLGIDIFTKD